MLIYNTLTYIVYTHTVIHKVSVEKYLQNKGNKNNKGEVGEKKKEEDEGER